MARFYALSSKGRRAPAQASPVRTSRSHAMQDNNPTSFPETSNPPHQTSRSVPSRPPSIRRRLSTSTGNNAGSLEEGASGDEADNDEDDDDDEDDEDNDEEPEIFAPSHARSLHQAGRTISPLQYENGIFAGSDEDDDDVYEAVNDISDSEDGAPEELEEQIEAFDEQDILHEFLDDIDGLSAVGYGGDLDPLEALTAFSDESGSSMEAVGQRRVHFSEDIEHGRNVLSAALSPLLTRALLPSALPDDAGVTGNNRMIQSSMVGAGNDPWGYPSCASPQQRGACYEDLSDSDATDEDLPAEAHTTPSALHHSPIEPALQEPLPPASQRKTTTPRRRGPRLGTFQVDRDKSWGLFDPESEKIVILAAPETGRYDWLAEMSEGSEDSASETPEASPRELLEESDDSLISSQENPGTADLMLASLISPTSNNGGHGQATEPVEAFFPPLYQTAGDYLVGPENFDDLDFSNEGDLPLSMTDLIEFDDGDDSDGDEFLTSPAIYMPPMHELFGSRSVHEQFPHLNNAFRRSTDPSRVPTGLPSLPHIDSSQQSLQGTDTRTPSRKRKAAPYTDKLYEGVTPTSRKLHTPKRRKVMT